MSSQLSDSVNDFCCCQSADNFVGPPRRGVSLWVGGATNTSTSSHNHHHHLSVGMAEKTFYAVSSSSNSATKDDSSCDISTKVPDSLEVLRKTGHWSVVKVM